MYIKKLVLKGYKRLFLAFINKLEFTPEKRINIIVGKNGSGKSSTLKELTPIPANINKDYEDGGYKEIVLEHNNKTYHLTSGLIGKNKHSFLVDNEELNPAGTRKVQLILVKEHFNVTPDIHDVLIGLKNFTDMSVKERKDWLTNISTVDYTYAISVFNKLKQRNRDIIGALKISQSELSKTSDGIKSDEELKKIEDELSILKELLMVSTASKTSLTGDIEIDEETIRQICKDANKIISKIVKPKGLSKDINIETLIAIDKTEIETIEKNIEKTNKVLKELSFIEDNKEKSSANIISDKLSLIEREIKVLEESMTVPIPLKEITDTHNYFSYIYQDLVSLITVVVDNTFDEYNKTNHDTDVAKKINLESKVSDKKSLLNKLEVQLATMVHNRDHNEVTCTKCNNIWSIGYDKKEHKYILRKIEEVNRTITSMEAEIKKLEDTLKFFINKMNAVSKIKDLIKSESNANLRKILLYVLNNSDLINNGQSTIDLLFKINVDFKEWLRIPSLLIEYDELMRDMNVIEAKRKLELEHFNVNKDKLEAELSDMLTRKRFLNSRLDEYNLYRQSINVLKVLNDKLIELLKQSRQAVDININNLRNIELNNVIKTLNLEISRLESQITESRYSKRIIDDNKLKVVNLNKRKKATDILIDGMSPTNGLIAKSITQFLNMFINDVNNVINSVWNYSIEVLPCNVTESADLDYKFEVKVDGRNIIEDISKTSSSMQEIINLAFKIISMKYLGMEDYPLYLDEYAASFDAHHAIKAYDVIESLSESSFNQVFMISHYENTYTRFADADISVLDPENLMLDRDLEINRVLTIL